MPISRETDELPDLSYPELVLTWDHDSAENLVKHGDVVIWRRRTGGKVWEDFGEAAAVLRRKYRLGHPVTAADPDATTRRGEPAQS